MATLAELAARIKELRANKAGLNEQIKVIDAELLNLESDLIDFMSAQGLNKVTSEGLTMSMKLQEIPAVEDWDALYDYVYDNRAGYLFQRRLTAVHAKELRDSGCDIPGIRWIEEPKMSYTAA